MTFNIVQRYLDGFQCQADDIVYWVMIIGEKIHIHTWVPEIGDDGAFVIDVKSIPTSAMSHIALELWMCWGLMMPGHEYLSPSETARRRAVKAALDAFGYAE